jgi:SAM-dependent methyltransferase
MATLRALIGKLLPLVRFRGSRDYWEARYRLGGHSGSGSRGANADYKATTLNSFIALYGIESIIEFGCGDGHQLGMLDSVHYIGVDISRTVINACRAQYAHDPEKRFLLLDDYDGSVADAAISLDVVFHLVEDHVYLDYLDRLFSAANRYVVIYSTSHDMHDTGVPHVRHRDVARDCADRYPAFQRMLEHEAGLPPPVAIDRGLEVRFFFFARQAPGASTST